MRITGTRAALLTGAIFAAMAIDGCASMNKSECLTVDWRTIGYEDGVAGYSGDRIAQHRKACAKYGVTPDLSLYQSGRNDGLHEYCQPANGFRVGARGGGYGGVCPPELEAAFVNAFETGHHLYSLQARVANTANEIEAKRRELNHIEDEIVRNAAAVVSNESNAEERAQALIDTKQLSERSGRIKAEIPELERDRMHYERELEEYRASIGYRE